MMMMMMVGMIGGHRSVGDGWVGMVVVVIKVMLEPCDGDDGVCSLSRDIGAISGG